MFRYLLALIFCAFISSAAFAGVTYRWENASSSSTISHAEGIIEIAYDAWASGSIHSIGVLEGPFDPGPLLNYSFAVYGINPITGISGPSSTVIGPDWAEWDIALSFLGDFAIGGIYVNCSACDATLRMGSGTDNLWMIDWASGPSEACSWTLQSGYTICSGATGRWVRVPEPPAPLLLGAGLLALLFTQRSRLQRGR